mgnify:CR=1 FL=1
MKTMKKILPLIMLAAANMASATTLSLSQTGMTLFNSSGTALTGNIGAKFGFWTSGFTPTADNLTQWDENFVAYNGYYQTSTSKFLISITVGDSAVSTNLLTSGETGFIGAGSQSGSTGFGAAWAAGKQLSLLVSNVAYNSGANTNSSTNANYLLPNTTTQYALLTDASWLVPNTAGALDVSTTTYNFTANTTASFGSVIYSSPTGGNSVTLVPEPSTGSLMMLGAVGLVALRRLRKV